MVDLELYFNPKPLLKKSVLYVYDTGYIKPFFREKIFSIRPEIKETTVKDCIQECKTSSLFGDRTFYISVNSKDELVQIMQLLKNFPEEDRIFVLCHKESLPENIHTKEYFKQEILEVEKTKPNFKLLLQFLQARVEMPVNYSTENPFFEKNMEELYSKCNDIMDFLQRAEYMCFICNENGKWNMSLFRTLLPFSEKTKYYALHEHLYFLLTTPSTGSKEQIFKYLSELLNAGQDPRQILRSIYRAIFELCEVATDTTISKETGKYKILSKFSYIPVQKLFFLTVKIPEFEKRLTLREDGFLSVLNEMLDNILENMP